MRGVVAFDTSEACHRARSGALARTLDTLEMWILSFAVVPACREQQLTPNGGGVTRGEGLRERRPTSLPFVLHVL